MKTNIFLFLIAISAYFPLFAESLPPLQEPQARTLKELDAEIDKLKSSLDVMEQEYHVLIRRTIIGFNNATYLRGGLSLLLPRARSFESHTDTGLGAFLGIGHYFGKNNVLEATLDWDAYLASTFRYRYEIQGRLNSFVFAPVIGVKMKLASLHPFDNFLDDPNEVKHFFPLVGGLLAFPTNHNLIALEIDYLFNTQAFIIANVGIHFFL